MGLEQQTVAEIASSSLGAIRVLERHGIDYCDCANTSLAAACRANGIEVEGVLRELDGVQTLRNRETDWTSAPLRDLIRFLQTEEHEFIRAELPLLQARMARVVEQHAGQYPQLQYLPKAFANLRHDLEAHMRHEENDLFPAILRHIEAAESGEPIRTSPLSAFGGPLRVVEMEHESAGAALRLLRDFCQNYNIPDDACMRYRALVGGLEELEDRLLRHIYLENNVLVPRACALKHAESQY